MNYIVIAVMNKTVTWNMCISKQEKFKSIISAFPSDDLLARISLLM
jgi:hypothetical protein